MGFNRLAPPIPLLLHARSLISRDSLTWSVWDQGGCDGTVPASVAGGQTGAICPGMVPAAVLAGYIGDNYAWQETAPDGTPAFFVLTGSNKCPAAKPWCGYGFDRATPQALLFRSTDLITWKFQSVFWSGAPRPGNRVDTPDTFVLDDGSQAFLWLTGGRTVWMRGSFDRSTYTFAETDHGIVDVGSFICQQSVTDSLGRRVQFGWIGVSGPGWSGAQSLPRTISVSTKAQRVVFNAHPALWTLHGVRSDVSPATLATGQSDDLTAVVGGLGGGTKYHLRIEITLPAAPPAVSVTLNVLGGHGHGGSSVTVTTIPDSRPTCPAGPIVNSSDSTADYYVGSSPYTLDPDVSGMAGAVQCQRLCCSTPRCSRFTYTDPQPGGNGHLCWLKGGPGGLVPNAPACAGGSAGHCWSGLVGKPPPPKPACSALPVVNNSDTEGNILLQKALNVSSGEAGAAACQSLCCATTGCALWTFTDPQPGTLNDRICYAKGPGTGPFPSADCSAGTAGHCWSGSTSSGPPVRPL